MSTIVAYSSKLRNGLSAEYDYLLAFFTIYKFNDKTLN